MSVVRVRCYAKINLTLDVLRSRADGYHDIDSVVTLIDLHDDLMISHGKSRGVTVEVDDPIVPAGQDNLVFTAAEEFMRYIDVKNDVAFHLRKQIPMQAGLGGGSSDAAGALLGLNVLLGTNLPNESLVEIASRVGSDVALFIDGGTVRMTGRGECIKPLRDTPYLWFVVIKPYAAVATSWAYTELDKRHTQSSEASSQAQAAILRFDALALTRAVSNDFDAVVRGSFPEIDRAARDLVAGGALRALLAGSGSAVFGVFYEEELATACASGLLGRYQNVMVARCLSRDEVANDRLAIMKGNECL